MSRSLPLLPGTTVYHAALTVHVTLVRENRNGESAAPGAVRPEYESLSTFICAVIIRCQRSFSAALSVWAETTWKTVGMWTLPLGMRGESLMTPYAFASLFG